MLYGYKYQTFTLEFDHATAWVAAWWKQQSEDDGEADGKDDASERWKPQCKDDEDDKDVASERGTPPQHRDCKDTPGRRKPNVSQRRRRRHGLKVTLLSRKTVSSLIMRELVKCRAGEPQLAQLMADYVFGERTVRLGKI